MKISLFFAILLANCASAQELVPNASFESWVGRTTDYPTSWNCGYCTKSDAHSGSFGARLDIPNDTSSKSLNTNDGAVSIESGKTYTVSYWYKTSNQDMTSSIINVLKPGGSRYLYGNLSFLVKDGQWHLYTNSFTADLTAGAKIDLSASVTYGVPGQIWYDDVSITNANLSTNDSSKKSLKIYPKLVDETITVSEPLEKLEIISADGKYIPVKYQTGDEVINLKHLTKGIYFVNIKSTKGNLIKEKIIKK